LALTRIHSAGTSNCGNRCAIDVLVQDGQAVAIEPSTAGLGTPAPCARGLNYARTFLSPDRLRHPLKRTGQRGSGSFQRISWTEATGLIAEQWQRIKAEYGPACRLVFPTGGSMASADMFAKRLLALDGGYLDTYNSYSSACTGIVTPMTYGDLFSGNSYQLLSESKLIILWGHNPLESGFGAKAVPALRAASQAGIPIICIDPRLSDTAKALGAEWIAIRPGTDAALAVAVSHVILSEHLEDRAFMDRCCLGFDAEHLPPGIAATESYEAYVFGRQDGVVKDSAWGEAICGVPAQVIQRLARAYAAAKPAALIQGLGPQRTCNGEQAARSAMMLAALTGNIGIPGGSAAGNGMIRQHPFPTIQRLPNPCPLAIPLFLWTDAITRAGQMTAAADGVRGGQRLETPVKMILSLGSNTLINQHSDVNRTAAILRDEQACEFIVASDVFMTPSARFADIVLPAASFLETEDIVYPWREGDYFLYSAKAIEPLHESRPEYYWLAEVAALLGLGDAFCEGRGSILEWLRDGYMESRRRSGQGWPDFEGFCRAGGYRYPEQTRYVAYADQAKDPAGRPFATPSGRIEIFSQQMHAIGRPDSVPAIPKHLSGFEDASDPLRGEFPIQLIGWHTKRRTHSVHDNNPYLEGLAPACVWINPADAQARSIGDGESVEVFNRRGTIVIPAKVTERIREGTAAIAQGAWHTPDGEGRDIRGNINTLTIARPTPLAKGNPQHSNLVQIRPAE